MQMDGTLSQKLISVCHGFHIHTIPLGVIKVLADFGGQTENTQNRGVIPTGRRERTFSSGKVSILRIKGVRRGSSSHTDDIPHPQLKTINIRGHAS